MEDSAGSDRSDRQWKSNGKRRKNCDHTVEEETAMKVLIVGSGGREHAIAASAAKSSKVERCTVHREMQGLKIRRVCADRRHGI